MHTLQSHSVWLKSKLFTKKGKNKFVKGEVAADVSTFKVLIFGLSFVGRFVRVHDRPVVFLIGVKLTEVILSVRVAEVSIMKCLSQLAILRGKNILYSYRCCSNNDIIKDIFQNEFNLISLDFACKAYFLVYSVSCISFTQLLSQLLIKRRYLLQKRKIKLQNHIIYINKYTFLLGWCTFHAMFY